MEKHDGRSTSALLEDWYFRDKAPRHRRHAAGVDLGRVYLYIYHIQQASTEENKHSTYQFVVNDDWHLFICK